MSAPSPTRPSRMLDKSPSLPIAQRKRGDDGLNAVQKDAAEKGSGQNLPFFRYDECCYSCDNTSSTSRRPTTRRGPIAMAAVSMSPDRKFTGYGTVEATIVNARALMRSVARKRESGDLPSICTFPNRYSAMSAAPRPAFPRESAPPIRKQASAGNTANTTTTAWVPLSEEENTKYLPNRTPLKSFISSHFISNDGAAAPKTSRRRAYTPDERRRVANTRKYGACKDCRARKVACAHALVPPAAAIDDYLQKPQQHEIFALALNTPSSTANVIVHKESMTKQIADIGDKLPEAQDDIKPSAGGVAESLVGNIAVKAFVSPYLHTPRPVSSCQTLKPPAKVHNVARPRSPSRIPQPGTGKFRLPVESTSAKSRVKRPKPDIPRTKNSTVRPTTAVNVMNIQTSSIPVIVSHEHPLASASAGQFHHDWHNTGSQVVVASHSSKAFDQNKRLFTREAYLMHSNSPEDLFRQRSNGSERDSLDSYMGEMITSSAQSASSSGDYRPSTPHDCRPFPVVEKDITLTVSAVPTEYDVTENAGIQPLVPPSSDTLPFSWTELLNRDIELDDEI